MPTDPSRTSAVTSIEEIRRRFPALERRRHGAAVAYFDGPGGTQVPHRVAAALTDSLLHHNANLHWEFPTSQEAGAAVDEARRALADFLNAAPAEIVFGANMTTLTFHLARALGRQFGPGDEIVVTELDHHANVAPWQALARERGVTVRVARLVPETGQIDGDDLARQVTPRSRLVAIGAASNALGTINDVALAVRLARAVGALVFVDAVHFAPHRLVDVRALDCDFLACSAYKFYGPHVGVLYGKLEWLQALEVPKLQPAPDTAPERWETGTQNHEGIVGAGAAIEELASFADGPTRRARLECVFEALHSRGEAQIERLWSGLAAVEGVRLYGPPPGSDRTPTLAFTVEGHPAVEVSRRLADRGIFASHGNFYAATVAERLGQAHEGFVRVGCACYTTEDEIERLLDAVAVVARGTR